MINFYELLNVDRNASSLEIKQAYRQMVKKYHPDINNSEEASKIIISLNEAKTILLDEDKRKDYDLKLYELENAKQFSKNKKETYNAKSREYKETYSESHVTRWEFFKNYFKFGNDSILIKFFKSFIAFLNFLLFSLLRILCFLLVYIVIVLDYFTYYVSGLLILIAVGGLILLKGKSSPDYVSFLPSNVEFFIFYTFIAIFIEFSKILILKNSINLSVLLQNLQDKILVSILMK